MMGVHGAVHEAHISLARMPQQACCFSSKRWGKVKVGQLVGGRDSPEVRSIFRCKPVLLLGKVVNQPSEEMYFRIVRREGRNSAEELCW